MISIQDLTSILQRLASGKMARGEAAAWAESCGGGYGEPNPFGSADKRGLAWSALNAVRAASVSDDFLSEGDPYFLRPSDFEEWAATLRGDVILGVNEAGVRPLRLHELGELRPTATLTGISVDQVRGRLQLQDLRGLDDLDYFQIILFQFDDVIFMLEWYPRSGPEATLYSASDHEPPVTPRLLGMVLELSPAQTAAIFHGA